ncbi:hypothetical protein [Dysgonomonas sp. GY75]|uniref:hypothetical protein n=1 Tax=Dysgonomonas sp. GY75 TaxID=2780419 RepID=UPI001F559622|nr:hypothetical protein [Dysgonomonas sp. GY75]
MNNLTTKERLRIFAKENGYGRNKFEEYIGIASGYLSSKSTSITSDTIEKTIDKFPDLNLTWLLTGKGSMLKTSGTVSEPEVSYGNVNKDLLTENESLKEQIKELEFKLKSSEMLKDVLQKYIDDRDKLIESLHKMIDKLSE